MEFKKNMCEFLGTQDPIVVKTSWQPLSSGSQTFKSHRLVQVNDHRLEFKMSLVSFFIYASTALIGFSIILFIVILNPSSINHPFLTSLLGVLFMVVGVVLFYFGHKKIFLDKNSMALWRGRQDMAQTINPLNVKGYRSLKKLHAVQLLKEEINIADMNTYYQDELNLVLNDGKRINIVHYEGEKSIRKQAEIVSKFFNIPLWDGRIEETPPKLSKSQKRIESIVVNTIGMMILIISSTIIYLIFFK